MAQEIYTVKLAGNSQLHEPVVKLENIQINLWSNDGGETWTNDNVIVGVIGQLQVFMSCKAITGTDWELQIKNTNTTTDILDENGTTGSTGTPNYSEFNRSVNP